MKTDHTVFAYVIGGEGYFDPSRDAYDREDVGEMYSNLERPCGSAGWHARPVSRRRAPYRVRGVPEGQLHQAPPDLVKGTGLPC